MGNSPKMPQKIYPARASERTPFFFSFSSGKGERRPCQIHLYAGNGDENPILQRLGILCLAELTSKFVH